MPVRRTLFLTQREVQTFIDQLEQRNPNQRVPTSAELIAALTRKDVESLGKQEWVQEADGTLLILYIKQGKFVLQRPRLADRASVRTVWSRNN